jgi:hypothetical protein
MDSSALLVSANVESRSLLIKLPPPVEGVDSPLAPLQERCRRFLSLPHLENTLAADLYR